MSRTAQAIESWARGNPRLTAPYGVLSSEGRSSSGRRYWSVTFGVSRISDVEVRVFSPNFILIRDTRFGNVQVKSLDEALTRLRAHYEDQP